MKLELLNTECYSYSIDQFDLEIDAVPLACSQFEQP